MTKLLLSIREATSTLGLSRSYVHALADAGILPTVRIGYRKFIRSADLTELAQNGTSPDVRIRQLRKSSAPAESRQ
jgi:excisionase family DNA binding protein